MVRQICETGNYQLDYEAGRKAGASFIDQLKNCDRSPFALSDIAERFSERFGAVERGFLAEISFSLM